MRQNIKDYFIVNMTCNYKGKKWSVRCGTDTTYLGALGLMMTYYKQIKKDMKLDAVLVGNIQAVEEYTEKDEKGIKFEMFHMESWDIENDNKVLDWNLDMRY